SGFGTVSGGKGVSSAPTRSGTASAKLATASQAPATTARRNLGIAHTYHARRRAVAVAELASSLEAIGAPRAATSLPHPAVCTTVLASGSLDACSAFACHERLLRRARPCVEATRDRVDGCLERFGWSSRDSEEDDVVAVVPRRRVEGPAARDDDEPVGCLL